MSITDFSHTFLSCLQEQVVDPIKKKFRNIRILLNQDRQSGENYYDNICSQIHLKNGDNQFFLLLDGGFTDWTRKIINNNKERFLSSGIGTELLIKTLSPKSIQKLLNN